MNRIFFLPNPMNLRSIVGLVLAALVLGGCIRLQSNTLDGGVPPFNRVLVVTKTKRDGDRYARQFLNRFPSGYEVSVLGFDDLSFGDADSLTAVRARENRCQVLLLVEIRPSGSAVSTGRYSAGPGFEWYAEMRALPSNQPFWKAATGISGFVAPPDASVFVNRLVKDGILR